MAVDGINITFKSCDCSSSSSSDEDIVPKLLPQIQAAPLPAPQIVPCQAPQIVPHPVPHPIPQTVPRPVPQALPSTSPQTTPRPVPQTPRPPSQTARQTTPRPVPQTTPGPAPQITPPPAPQTTTRPTPQTTTRPAPQTTNRPAPQTTPHATSQILTKSRRRLWGSPHTPVIASQSLSYRRAEIPQSQPQPRRAKPQVPQENLSLRRRWDPPSQPQPRRAKPQLPQENTSLRRRWDPPSMPKLPQQKRKMISFRSPESQKAIDMYKAQRYSHISNPRMSDNTALSPLGEPELLGNYAQPMTPPPQFGTPPFNQQLQGMPVELPMVCTPSDYGEFGQDLRYNVSMPRNLFPEPSPPGSPPLTFTQDLYYPQNKFEVSGGDLRYDDSYCPPYCGGLPSTPGSDFLVSGSSLGAPDPTFANLSGDELSTLQSQFLVSGGSLGAHTPTCPYLSGNELSTPKSEFLVSGGDLAGDDSFCPQLCGDELSTLPSEFLASGGSLGAHTPQTFPYLSGDELSTPQSEFLVSGGDLAGDDSFCPQLCGDELSTLPSEFLASGGSLGANTPQTFPYLSGNELSTPQSEFLVSGADLAGDTSFCPQLCGDELSTLPSEFLASGGSLGAQTPPTFPYVPGDELSTPQSEFLVSGGDLAGDDSFCPQLCGDELSTPRSEFLASGVQSQRQNKMENSYENEMPSPWGGLPNQNLEYESCPRLCGSEMSTPGSSMLVSGGSLRGTSMPPKNPLEPSPNIPLEQRYVQKQTYQTSSNITSDVSTDDKSSSFRSRQRKRLSPCESESRGSSSSSKKVDNQIAKIAGRSFLPTSIKEARSHITDAIKNMFSKDEPSELDAIVESVRMFQSFRRNVAIASTPVSSPVNTPTRPIDNPSCTKESNCA